MRSIAVLQARTNSTRLPGKALLPVAGLPLVVLAAKRAANTGRLVIVATSEEPVDDALVRLLNRHEICSYRGSLDDPLGRVVAALAVYGDDTLVFRLTGDNVFPDGALLDEMEETFLRRRLNYLCCNAESSGLPYGLSAELMPLRALREAWSSTTAPFDREHVTPYVRRRYGVAYFEKYKFLEAGGLRCTVDCLDEYLNVERVFSQVVDPVAAPWLGLIRYLSGLPFQPWTTRLAKKLVLGTAQFGMDYGIANEVGKPTAQEAARILKGAVANGVTTVDTARAYGDSEDVIGKAFENGWQSRTQIVTKLDPLSDCSSNASFSEIRARVDSSVFQSCLYLRKRCLDVAMLHRASHLTEWGGAAWGRLIELKHAGWVKSLGVSVQDPSELEWVLRSAEVECIQMPFNLLDWRWDGAVGLINEEKLKRNVVVYVRSSLLQGLLPSRAVDFWKRAGVHEPKYVIDWLKRRAESVAQIGVAELCLRYVKSLSWVDGVVVGMETFEQLVENVRVFGESDFSVDQLETIVHGRPILSSESLNPSSWRNPS